MATRHRVVADASDVGQRLDVVVCRHLQDVSRTLVGELIRAGHVFVDNRPAVKPAERVRTRLPIVVDVPSLPPPALAAEDIDLVVLFEDDDLIVVNKAAGMVVHPAHGHTSGTLVNALLGRQLAPAPDDEPFKPGIVHRLDKDTSGCLVVARTVLARSSLEQQFRDRQVGKTYRAVVHGVPSASGRVEAAVGRDPANRKRMSVRSRHGRSAESTFQVVERFEAAAYLTVRIATGRTHQIRVHLASIGHPIVGDQLYGGRRGRPDGPLFRFPRQALHAAELRITHPRSQEPLEFVAPLPMDMAMLLDALRNDSSGPVPAGKIKLIGR